MNFTPILTNPYAVVALALFVLAFVYLSLYYGLVFLRVGRYREKEEVAEAEALPGVSVVLTAHNDGDWLKENLPYLLEQDYPNYEIVVVDYVSSDETPHILKLCKDYYPNLKVVNFPEDVNMFRGKKYPLSIGIKSAKNDVLLFADADCMPKGFNWVRTMVKGYGPRVAQASNGRKIILGYSGIKQEKSLFNWLQVYDNMVYNSGFLASALLGHPFTGCGRNLSYRRSFFFDKGGFISHYTIPYGADDLFVNQNATSDNTAVVLDADAFVFSEAQPTFNSWHLLRRMRTASYKTHRWSQRLVMAAYPLSVLFFYVAMVVMLLFEWFPWQIILGVFVAKLAWQIVSVYQVDKRFEISRIHWVAPLFEIYFLFANTILKITPLPKR